MATSLDFSGRFSGSITGYELIGTWPTGLSIDSSGVVSGSATVAGYYPGLRVRATNLSAAYAETNEFALSVSKFGALVPDFDGAMQGVKVGTGDLTTTHTADLYAQDSDGVYRQFGANEAVWSGGYTLRNGKLNSNLVAGFTPARNASLAQDEIGLDGAANTAITLTHGPNTDAPYIVVSETDNVSARTAVVYAKKGTGVAFRLVFTTSNSSALFDLNAGTVSSLEGGANAGAEIVDIGGGWYQCLLQDTNNVNGREVRIYPYITLPTPPDYLNPSDDCTIIIGNVESHVHRTIAEVKAPTNGWIFTTTAAQSKTWAIDGTGTPLAEMPYLQYYPAAQNELRYSNAPASWSTTGGTLDISATETGITGEPNTASSYERAVSSGTVRTYKGRWFSVQAARTTVAYAKAFSGTASWLHMIWTGEEAYAQFNLTAGTLGPTGGVVAAEIIDIGGGWYKCIMETGALSTQLNVYPFGDQPTATANPTDDLPGGIVWGNVEVYDGKSLSECRGLPPIFTEASAVATDAILYDFDPLNIGNAAFGCWYTDIDQQSANEGANYYSALGSVSNRIFNPNAADQFGAYIAPDNPLVNGITGTPRVVKLGTIWSNSDNQFVVNADGTYGAVSNSTNPFNTTELQIRNDGAGNVKVPFALRNLQRYDITSYAEGKDIIDDLMST